MKNMNKIMAIMPLAASMVVPMTAFAKTDYVTSVAAVVETQEVKADSNAENMEERQVEVSVVQASAFSVSIPKQISLNGAKNQKNDSDYKVKVAGNIASDEVITVIPVESFEMSDTKGNKAPLTAVVTQKQIKFVNDAAKGTDANKDAEDTVAIEVEMEDTPSVTGNVEVKKLTAGSWQGKFNFDIKLQKATALVQNN